MKTTVYAGTSLEPELPKCDNVQDWTISRDTDLAWLAGIVDGEGHIGLGISGGKPFKQVTVTNTDYDLLQKVSTIYEKLNLRFHYEMLKGRSYKRDCFVVVVNHYGSIKKLLQILMPYLTGKKDQANKMLEFITYKEGLPRKNAKIVSDPVFLKAIEDLQVMKRKLSGLSTTTRVASKALPRRVV